MWLKYLKFSEIWQQFRAENYTQSMVLDDKNVSLLFFLGIAAAKSETEELPVRARQIKNLMETQIGQREAINQIQQLLGLNDNNYESESKLRDLESKVKILELEERCAERENQAAIQAAKMQRKLKREEEREAGVITIRNIHQYKEDICDTYLNNNGQCPEGIHCQFAHGTDEIRDRDDPIQHYLEEFIAKNPDVTAVKVELNSFRKIQNR